VEGVAGVTGGVAGIWVGAPLDVIKTRVQASGGRQSPLAAAAAALREGGPRALFRGSVVASLGQAPNNFIVFGTHSAVLNALTAARGRRAAAAGGGGGGGGAPGGGRETAAAGAAPSRPPTPTPPPTRYGDVYIAGSVAGLLQSIALTPFELVKVQQQVSGGRGAPLGRVAADIVAAAGPAGLFRGFTATALRDTPTYGVYFALFEWVKAALGGGGPGPAPVHAVLAAGAAAGVASWGLALPFDVVKTVTQALPVGSGGGGGGGRMPPPPPSFRAAAAAVWAKDGVAGFYRGATPVLLRAAPVNAVTFLVYEAAAEAARGAGGTGVVRRGEGDVCGRTPARGGAGRRGKREICLNTPRCSSCLECHPRPARARASAARSSASSRLACATCAAFSAPL
jgi:solute carrier family 25 (mitochondrial carnitine/acylcarnitine transporter), member 20/29